MLRTQRNSTYRSASLGFASLGTLLLLVGVCALCFATSVCAASPTDCEEVSSANASFGPSMLAGPVNSEHVVHRERALLPEENEEEEEEDGADLCAEARCAPGVYFTYGRAFDRAWLVARSLPSAHPLRC